MVLKNPNTEPETSCESLVVKWNQSRCHGGLWWAIPPKQSSKRPQIEIGNVINQCNFCQLGISSPPLHKRKAPYWRVSGDGSAWNHPFHESDVVVANVTSQSRNPYVTNQACSANKKSEGSWEHSQKSSHFKTALYLFLNKTWKRCGKAVPKRSCPTTPLLPIEATVTQSGNCSWFVAKSSRIFSLLAV